MRLRRIVFVTTAALAGVVLGLASLVGLVAGGGGFKGVPHAGWSYNPLAGSQGADPYTRLKVAVGGLLALDRSETIYFTTATDSTGAALRADCRYRITGGAMPVRWWSITLYDKGYLARNSDGAPSIDRTRAAPDAAGRWSAQLGGARPANGLWISSATATDVSLLLRFYNPDPAVVKDPTLAPMPVVTRETCTGGAS
jgi:hypothetical protein